MAMHMQMADAARSGEDVPEFMVIAGIPELPSYWQPFASAPVAILSILVLPALLAAALGFGVFKRRVKGAYFAILSQALAAALAILLTGQQTIGGFTGLSDFRSFFGFRLDDPVNRRMLFFIAAGALLAVVAIARQLMHSRYGELLVAVRDQEERVRFLGYDPANIKIVAYVVAAFFAGIAGRCSRPSSASSPRRYRGGALHRLPHRRRHRRAHHAARSGAGRHRRGVGADHVLRAVPLRLDVSAGCAVHRGGRLPARRSGRIRAAGEATRATGAAHVPGDRRRGGSGRRRRPRHPTDASVTGDPESPAEEEKVQAR